VARLWTLAEQINEAATAHPRMREFQEIRRRIHGLPRVRTNKIFSRQTTFAYWAFHSGGRKELQYNIGFEDEEFRFGVAFSLEPSRTLLQPLVLTPKIEKLNKYVSENLAGLQDLSSWSWSPNRSPGRSAILPVAPFPSELIRRGNFLFLGRLVPTREFNPSAVVFLFDRLLDMYKYVEGNSPLKKDRVDLRKGFEFKSGCSLKPEETSADIKGGRRKVGLSQNRFQRALFDILSTEYGAENVGTENDTGRGSRVDLVVRDNRQHYYYEIKTNLCVRSCIREALSQLLEYSYWPGGFEADRMIVVSANPLTLDAQCYVKALRQRFRLPIYYQYLDMRNGVLGPLE
jgi:hypothetical protein